jgi:hypothetical protein
MRPECDFSHTRTMFQRSPPISLGSRPRVPDVGFWPNCEVPTGSGSVCCWGQIRPKADIANPTRLTRSGHSTSPSRCECCPYRPCLRSTAVVEASSLRSPRSRGRREWAQTPAPDVLDRLGAGCALTARFQPAPHSPLHDDGLWQCRAAAKSAKTSD